MSELTQKAPVSNLGSMPDLGNYRDILSFKEKDNNINRLLSPLRKSQVGGKDRVCQSADSNDT